MARRALGEPARVRFVMGGANLLETKLRAYKRPAAHEGPCELMAGSPRERSSEPHAENLHV